MAIKRTYSELQVGDRVLLSNQVTVKIAKIKKNFSNSVVQGLVSAELTEYTDTITFDGLVTCTE